MPREPLPEVTMLNTGDSSRSTSGENTPLLLASHDVDSRNSTVLPSIKSTHSSLSQLSSPTENHRQITRRPCCSKVVLSSTERVILFLSIFIAGYAYGLESQVRSTYQPYATSSFSLHSYLATINVLRSVIAVAAQPTAAKVADVFGRFDVILASTGLYVLGIALEATASSVQIFCLGSIIYQIGYTCTVLLMEVLVADYSSMRARVFLSYIPAVPFLINTWLSGTITSAVLATTTWRWGIGMWAIIYPIAIAPLLIVLYSIDRRKRGFTWRSRAADKAPSFRQRAAQLSHQVDIIGLVTLVASFSLVLAPLTMTGAGTQSWHHPTVAIPLTIGLLLFPVFVLWEKNGAQQPLIPFHLLADRGVWSALAVRSLLNFAWYTQSTYLYTVLIVAFDFHVDTATRILSFFSFFGVVGGVIMGLVIYKIRRLKIIIIIGTLLFMFAFSLLIRYSGGATSASQRGLVAAQVLLGLAGGLFAYPTQASVQASASRDHVAIITGLYLSFYNFGSALGTCLAGAIWTRLLLPLLEANLAFQSDSKLARQIYSDPFDTIPRYPVGTEIRTAVILSYQHVQRLLCIAGFFLCIPMIIFAVALRNPRLSEEEVQPEAESPIGSQI